MHPNPNYNSHARARGAAAAPASQQQQAILSQQRPPASFTQMVLAGNHPVGMHSSPAADPSSMAWRQMQQMQGSLLTLPQYQDEIESDELEESDEEAEAVEESTGQPEAVSREDADDQPVHYDTTDYDCFNDDELYENFIQQYILTNEEGGEGSNLLLQTDETDEDDEEDYEPEDDESDGDDEDDDEDDDDLEAEGNRVQKKELRELLNDCWLTIADADITLPEYDYSDRDSNPSYPSAANNEAASYFSEHHPAPIGYAFPDPQTSLHQADASYSSPRPPTASNNNNAAHLSPKEKHLKTNANLVSSFVTQVFAGNKPSEICIDGVPVGAIRKVVARQMSMSLQLLIQILFLAENRSECWKLAYSSLLHLTNLRESAVKKAALLQINMENVAALRNFNMDDSKRSGGGMLRNNEYKQLFDEVNPHLLPSGTAFPQQHHTKHDNHQHTNNNNNNNMNRRMTRSTLINYNSRSNRTSSIFDIPVLSRIGDLMMRIDHASKRINHFKQLEATTNPVTTDASTRHSLLAYCEKEIEEICKQLPIKAWQCLIPTATYPFRESYPFQHDASSVLGQTHFSPAEDDLLLRGILAHGENAWDVIRLLLLPSKDSQLLYYRYCQQTMITSNLEYNDFKRFKHLASQRIKKRHREDRWSLAEDLNLLRGYELFGEKWPLVVIFFLPHLKISDVRIRWGLMQKIWNKAFPNVQHGQWIMTPGVKAFLSDLHQCNSFKELKDFAESGGVELRKLNDANYNDQTNVKAALGMDAITERLVDAYDHSMFDQDELSDSDKEDDAHQNHAARRSNSNAVAALYQPMYNQTALMASVPNFLPSSTVTNNAAHNRIAATTNKRVSFAEPSNAMDMSAYTAATMVHPQNMLNYPYQNPAALMAMNPILSADALAGPLLLHRFPDSGEDGNTDAQKTGRKRAYAGVKNRGQSAYADSYASAPTTSTTTFSTAELVAAAPPAKKVTRPETSKPSAQDALIDLTASNPALPMPASSSSSSSSHHVKNTEKKSSHNNKTKSNHAAAMEVEETSQPSHDHSNALLSPDMDFSLGGFSNIMAMSLMKAPNTAIEDSKEKDDSRSNGTMSSASRLSSEGIFAQVTAGASKRS